MGKKKHNSSFLSIQIIFCTITMLLAITLKNIDNKTFCNLKELYNTKLNEQITFGKDKQTYQDTIKPFFDNKKNIFTNTNRTSGITAPYTDLSIPLSTPVEDGIVTSQFGLRKDPITGQTKNHFGLDIAANKNSVIHSVMPGKVEKVDQNNSYGNYLILDHGNSIKTLYAHCEKILVSQSEPISREQAIALVGSTGESTGDHLHFEVIINDIKYNPEPLLNL